MSRTYGSMPAVRSMPRTKSNTNTGMSRKSSKSGRASDMEFINAITIQGVTGAVAITPVGDTRMARFSVVTETAYNGHDGGIIVDCTWFSVSAFESAKIRCLDQLAKGKVVRVLGRVRVQRYTDGNGAERSCWEIIAHEVEVKEDRV